ncbi:MAG: carboxypeptidase regulatory-like domain-containing protein [Planctomycetaceae bacterium]|nr:carboxypeptidase regulatory-like domain-containing protein [Planctomycetaceae bacterium]
MLKSVFAYISICSGLVLVGCGSGVDRPSTSKVEGTVTFDNQPLEGASISFIPQDGRPASGFTDASGHFVLKTFEAGDGAIPGEHTVIVTKVTAESNSGDDIYAKQKSVIPEKYGDLKKSGLTATVKADGENNFNFDLKK